MPLRAISESMGAEVEWNGTTHTVDISYNRTSYYTQAECNHTNTIEATLAGIKDFENTGSSTTHKVIEYAEIVCEDCGDTIDTKEKERTESHNFEDNVCIDCGYQKKQSCSHLNTHEVIMIDAREYENTGSSSTHKVIDEVAIYCDDCDEQTDTKYKKTDKPHNFEGNICVDCGYEQDKTYSTSNNSVGFSNLSYMDYNSTIASSFFNIDGCIIDIGDNKHTDGILFKLVNSGKINYNAAAASLNLTYDLQGQYNSLSGYICPIKEVDITGLKQSLYFSGSSGWHNAFLQDAEYIIEIYGDDNCIYTSPTIIGNNINTKFNVNIENFDTLTIKVYNPTPVKRYNNDKIGFIALTDLVLN